VARLALPAMSERLGKPPDVLALGSLNEGGDLHADHIGARI
jgi:hypothetical protein